MEHERKDTRIIGEPAKAEAEEREYPRRDVTIIGQPASASGEGKAVNGA